MDVRVVSEEEDSPRAVLPARGSDESPSFPAELIIALFRGLQRVRELDDSNTTRVFSESCEHGELAVFGKHRRFHDISCTVCEGGQMPAANVRYVGRHDTFSITYCADCIPDLMQVLVDDWLEEQADVLLGQAL